MALKSVRTGLVIGTLTTLIVTPFAILFGVLAGYFGGYTDDIIQYVYTTLSSIPDILLIAAAMLIFQVGLTTKETILSADERLVYLCIIMGITSWTGLCRLIRAEVLKLREIEYIQAADAFGVARATIMFRHLVPNVLHIVLISVDLALQRPGAGRGRAGLCRYWRRSLHAILGQHDQPGPPRTRPRTRRVVEPLCRLYLHARVSAASQCLWRCGARCPGPPTQDTVSYRYPLTPTRHHIRDAAGIPGLL